MTDQDTRSSAVAVQQGVALEELKEQVRLIEQTDFVPKNLRGNKHAILACVLYGQEIGLKPMESLAEIHMIDGRPSLSAKGKLKRARQAGHSVTGSVDAKQATVTGRRCDNGDEMTVTFTMDQAKAAGLLTKDNWKRHPEDMLWARAVSRLCRRLFDDIPGVLMLDPDEAELTPDERVLEAIGEEFTPPATSLEAEATGTVVGSVGASASSDDEEVVGEGEIVEAEELFPIPESARQHEDHG